MMAVGMKQKVAARCRSAGRPSAHSPRSVKGAAPTTGDGKRCRVPVATLLIARTTWEACARGGRAQSELQDNRKFRPQPFIDKLRLLNFPCAMRLPDVVVNLGATGRRMIRHTDCSPLACPGPKGVHCPGRMAPGALLYPYAPVWPEVARGWAERSRSLKKGVPEIRFRESRIRLGSPSGTAAPTRSSGQWKMLGGRPFIRIAVRSQRVGRPAATIPQHVAY